MKFARSALNSRRGRVDSLVMEPASSAQDSTTTTSGMDVSRQSILPFGDLKEHVGVSVHAESAEGCVSLARCSGIHVQSHFATGFESRGSVLVYAR